VRMDDAHRAEADDADSDRGRSGVA
jgi:hypothetical protein